MPDAEDRPSDQAAPTYAELEREHRIALRRLRRLEDNNERLENIQESNSRLLSRLLADLEQERERSHQLLLNILPQRIIDRLAAGERLIADRHDDTTVLFLDVVGFTRISAGLAPATLVERLNALFSGFDAICGETGVEKIKTAGDAYLAVGGLGESPTQHTPAVAETAIRILESRSTASSGDSGEGTEPAWAVRIGISRGPLVAGVIGSSKFAYDVWGDTVNLASRLETAAAPGQVLVSEPVARALRPLPAYRVEPVGALELKGKGATPAWALTRGSVPIAASG